jgi:hypothetical protein
LPDFAGRVRFRRSFGAPKQLDPHEHVWLTLGGADSAAWVWLNSQFLGHHEGGSDSFEFEVTSLLGNRNKLVVEVEGSAEAGGLWGEVALEIRCAAFLRSVRVWPTFSGDTATLHAAGQVVGVSEQALELYLVLDRSTVAYAAVGGSEAGRPFQVVSDGLSAARWRHPEGAKSILRIDLVNAGTVWYTIEQSVELKPNASGDRSASGPSRPR